MVRLRVVDEDGRTAAERAEALHGARDGVQARTGLDAVLRPLRAAQRELESRADRGSGAHPPARVWALLDEAYLALDSYLGHLVSAAELNLACGPRCSACCTDLPPVVPIEALRMVRALRSTSTGPAQIQRAVEQARAFQQLLLTRTGPQPRVDTSAPAYRQAQLDWRGLGHPCPVLGDDGNCSAYAARPLACRVHVHVEDPAHCEPRSPRFLTAERPPLWGHPREAEVELALAALGKLLGLPSVPNLQWGIALLHGQAGS